MNNDTTTTTKTAVERPGTTWTMNYTCRKTPVWILSRFLGGGGGGGGELRDLPGQVYYVIHTSILSREAEVSNPFLAEAHLPPDSDVVL